MSSIDFDALYRKDMPKNVKVSKLTADKAPTRGLGGNVLKQGDVIEFPNTENPVIYDKAFNPNNPAQKGSFIVVMRNGHPFEFFYSQLGKSVIEYDEETNEPVKENGETKRVESSSTVSTRYRALDMLSDFLHEYKSKKIEVGGHQEVHTVYGATSENPRPKTSWVYDFEPFAEPAKTK